MPIEMAAYYVGNLAADTAKKQFDVFGIKPVSVSDGRAAYLKEDLDRFLAHKAGRQDGDDWLGEINGQA